MPDAPDPTLGRLLVVAGLALAGLGLVLVLGPKLGLGRLPGDFSFHGKRTTVYIPIVTCLVLSLLASLLFSLFSGRR